MCCKIRDYYYEGCQGSLFPSFQSALLEPVASEDCLKLVQRCFQSWAETLHSIGCLPLRRLPASTGLETAAADRQSGLQGTHPASNANPG